MVNLNNSEKRLIKLVLQNEALRHYNEYLKKVKTLYHGEERPGDGELELSHFYNELADKIEEIIKKIQEDYKQ